MIVKRNIVVILAHGLRSDALADEREWALPTPHLVELANRGVRLVLTAASVSDPGAMASALTGLHARQHGQLTHDLGLRTMGEGLPAWLRKEGYHTVGVGEVGDFEEQLDEARVTAPVDVPEPAAGRCWYAAAARARGHTPALAQQRRQRLRLGPIAPDRIMLEPEEDIDGFIAQLGVDAIADMPEDRPWALFVVFSGPGNALPPPVGYDEVVKTAGLARNFTPVSLEGLDDLAVPQIPRAVLQRLETHQVERLRADYLGRVSLIDHGVGQIQNAVDGRSDAGKTYTVVSSDRGCMLGEHGLVGGSTFLASAVEVPLIVAPPVDRSDLAPKEKFQEGLFSVVDIAPTVAALAGADMPVGRMGRSVLPLFNGDALALGASANISEFDDRVMVETERFKAVFRVTDRSCLALHDLAIDPDERNNLVYSENGQAQAAALRHVLGDALMSLRAVAEAEKAVVVQGL
ncbi:MAG: sulfatase-like hydrolase/transferase [Algisphaera sp.]